MTQAINLDATQPSRTQLPKPIYPLVSFRHSVSCRSSCTQSWCARSASGPKRRVADGASARSADRSRQVLVQIMAAGVNYNGVWQATACPST